MPEILVFDVNETLLDVGALEPAFTRAFGDGSVFAHWFSELLLYSQSATLMGAYADFPTIAGAVLQMTAAARGVQLSDAQRLSILTAVRSLPAHPDVVPALERLRDAGRRMVTLTNSSPAALKAQLANAGLTALFERAFSVDAVRRFKPAPEPYRHVARELGVDTKELRMVAAHAWDVAGAMQAGCRAAFVARPGKVLYPLLPPPDIVGADLLEVAEAILRQEA